MKHQTLDKLQEVAEVKDRPALTRAERLERWAELLEKDPDRRLATLHQTEYQPIGVRETMRSAGSPISVAFEDPILRAEGMKDDSYGEAKRFFELTDGQLHEVLCYCHFGETVRAASAARHVRAAIQPRDPSMFARMHAAFAW
jgi:hypothetical protein